MARAFRRLALAAVLAGCAAGGAQSSGSGSCPANDATCAEGGAPADEESSLIQLAKLKEVPEPRTRSNKGGRVGAYPKYVLSTTYKNPLCQKKSGKEVQLVKKIGNNKVYKELKALVNLPTPKKPSRSAVDPVVTAPVVDYLKKELASMGHTVCLQTFPVSYGSYQGDNQNVIAYIPGTDPAEGSVTIGAHYDSRPYGGMKAPGADDNGSGTAVVLATARAYAKVNAPPKKSIYFVAFGAEEVGLFGSHFFVEALMKGAKSLPAECRPSGGFPAGADHRAITLDMVGWRSPNPGYEKPTLTLETRPWSKDVTEEVAQASKRINKDKLDLRINTAPFGSDHMSFLDQNLHAMLAIHGDDSRYPAYHQSSDVLANTDPLLMGMIARACAGALMRIADIDMKC